MAWQLADFLKTSPIFDCTSFTTFTISPETGSSAYYLYASINNAQHTSNLIPLLETMVQGETKKYIAPSGAYVLLQKTSDSNKELAISICGSDDTVYWTHSGTYKTLSFRSLAIAYDNDRGLCIPFDCFIYTGDDDFRNGYIRDSVTDPSGLYTALTGSYSTNNPYDKGGDSSTGGGTGDFDGTSDSIDIPELPFLSAVDTGFITLFNPSLVQLKNLASYMWSDLFSLDTFKKIFADPMDCILGLSIVPVNVPSGATSEVVVGNISTGVSMTRASSQYVELDCGTINVNEYWGSYLDYAPYTKAEIYLPYIGTHPIDIDDIMGKAVHVVYHIDILSGACTCYVKCGSSVLYTFNGQCSSSIPVSGDDFTNVINGILTVGTSIGTMVATGGLSVPKTVAEVGSMTSSVGSLAGSVTQMKPSVEKSGSMSGTGGLMAVQTPYIILTRPSQCVASEQNTYTGYPSHVTMKLSNVSGYTVVESIHLDNVTATETEKDEIVSLLQGGVIF